MLSQLLVILSLCVVVSGCQTGRVSSDWPAEMPPKKVFIDGLSTRLGVEKANKEQIDFHLLWVSRFYQGTTLYPTGWLSMTEQLLATVKEPERRESIAKRMRSLGISIGNEWALENEIRRINNACVATWASALKTSAERNEQELFISQVERDVNALLTSELQTGDIEYERYYTDESLDDF